MQDTPLGVTRARVAIRDFFEKHRVKCADALKILDLTADSLTVPPQASLLMETMTLPDQRWLRSLLRQHCYTVFHA